MACSRACSARYRCRGETGCDGHQGRPGRRRARARAVAVTGRAALIALIATLVALAFRTAGALVAADGLIVIAIAADVALAASVRQLRVTRSGDTRILLGQPGQVAVTVVNQGHRALRGIVRDAWEPSVGARPERFSVAIPAGGQITVASRLRPARRGDRPAGPVTIRSVGPLGLAARQSSHPAPWSVRVLPPFFSRKHLPEKLAQLRLLDGQHRSMIRGKGAEFDSLREYVIGDEVRSIDWRASARRTDLMVRTWRPERDRRIVIVLDTGRTSAGRVAGLPRLDTAMDAALLLAALASRAGDRIDLVAVDSKVRARVIGSRRGDVLAAITDALAVLEAQLTESDAGLMASTVLAMARQRCLVVLLTDLNPAALQEGLLPRLPLLVSRHRLLLAAVSDPRLTQMAAERGDAIAVYDAAAAEHAVAQRARIRAQLTRHGVDVVDAPPDRLPAALADAYLRLKAAGQL
jgi:uncharacterized protein (DUF58 family)